MWHQYNNGPVCPLRSSFLNSHNIRLNHVSLILFLESLPSFSSSCVYVCVLGTCEFMFVYRFALPWRHTLTPEVGIMMSSSITSPFYFLRQRLTDPRAYCFSETDEPSRSACLSPPVLGLQTSGTMPVFFMCTLRIWTQVLWFAQWAFCWAISNRFH